MSALHYTTATLSRAGGREYNEDALGFRESAVAGGCWVLADGLGGHGGGEVASRLAVETLLHGCESETPCDAAQIHSVLEQVERTIRTTQQSDPRLRQMRATLTALFCHADQALWVHIGDTRLYHLRAGRIRFQTADHSVPWALLRAGEITRAEVRHHEDRNRLLRTLGNDKPLRPEILAQPEPLQAGDAFLLCSDGFWEYVSETEMEVALCKSSSPEAWLQQMELIVLQRSADDHDNYSALGVWVR